MCVIFFSIFTLLFFDCLASRKDVITSKHEPTTEITISKDLIDYGWRVHCKFQPNGNTCGHTGIHSEPRFYYDVLMEDCKTFYIGTRCIHNYNGFGTLRDCQSTCREEGLKDFEEKLPIEAICRLQPDFGKCNDYHPMWYYNVTQRQCRGFSYSGCGGNLNRFSNAQTCTTTCSNIEQ